MREIKFRVWDRDKKTFITDIWYGFAAVYSRKSNSLFSTEEFVVQQFTGLKDKNGKDIYEGDIIQCFGYPLSKVEYSVSYGCCFAYRPFGSLEYLPQDIFIEVVGNIYQTPYLLK